MPVRSSALGYRGLCEKQHQLSGRLLRREFHWMSSHCWLSDMDTFRASVQPPRRSKAKAMELFRGIASSHKVVVVVIRWAAAFIIELNTSSSQAKSQQREFLIIKRTKSCALWVYRRDCVSVALFDSILHCIDCAVALLWAGWMDGWYLVW